MARVAILGAAGYLGLVLCRHLKASGHEVTGVARANGSFLLERAGIRHALPQEAPRAGPFDAVVNLAYPKSPAGFDFPQGNRAILATLRALAGTGARVVHASTIAVFGYALEHEPVAAAVPMRRDYGYIESKIELERLLLDAQPGCELQIVRLGNIWGPASATWTAGLADRLLFGDPVGVAQVDGYSNTTDVENAASYLAHVALLPGRRAGGFHHLAEFSALRWSHWLERLARALKVEPVTLARAPALPSGFAQELLALNPLRSPFAMARDIMRGRFVSSWAGSVLRRLPAPLLERVERAAHVASGSAAQAPAAVDPALLAILGTQRRIESRVDPAWRAPRDAEASWTGVAQWLQSAGYC